MNNTQVDSRISSLDVKLASLNSELGTYQQRLARMRSLPDSSPAKSALRQKAMKLLQQRKMYESQREQLQQQSWNMEQAGMMQDNLQNAMVTVEAMKSTTKELKKQYGREGELVAKVEKAQDELAEMMDVGEEVMMGLKKQYGREGELVAKVEKAQDELAEMMDVGEEVMMGLGRSAMFDVPEGVSEEDLDAELEALGEEMVFEGGAGGAMGVGEMPGFMVDETAGGGGSSGVPAFVDEAPADGKAKEVPAG